MVVDHERNVSLKFARGAGRGIEWGAGKIYRLVWEHRTIAIEATSEEMTDPKTHETYYLRRFKSFGGREYVLGYNVIESYDFQSEDERHQAELLAIEAFFVMGDHYNGDTKPEGYDRFEYKGRIYTKKDFGLA